MWLASQAGPDPKNMIPKVSLLCGKFSRAHCCFLGEIFRISYMDSTFHIAYRDDASLFMHKMKTGRPVKFYRH